MELSETEGRLVGARFNRRDFLKAGAAGIGVVALASLAGCSSAEETGEPLGETGEGDGALGIEWAGEADVIFVGAGGAGLYGAAAVLEEGATALVLEKEDEANAGGDTRCYGGIFAVNPASFFMAASLGTMEQETADAIAEGCTEIVEWFEDNTDIQWVEGAPQKIAVGAGPAVYESLMQFKDEAGIEVVYNAPGRSLIVDDEGRVVGVRAGEEGQERCYRANKGVVLTTGGYEGNKDMVQTMNSSLIDYATMGHPACTGDGIAMGVAAGAALSNVGSGVEWSEMSFAEASREMGTSIPNRQCTTATMLEGRNIEQVPSKIYVNVDGQRFTDESTMITHNKSFALPFLRFGRTTGGFTETERSFKNLPAFLVCDDDCVKGQPLGKVPSDNEWMYVRTFDVYDWSDDNQAEVERGWIKRADTIEELAALMTATDYVTGETVSVDPEGLKATVEAYNAACASGEDAFGRPAEYLRPIATPPFYAAEMMPTIVFTLGGLRSDKDGRVLDWNNEPIPGLYCAGNVGQGTVYPIGACACMVRGKLAGIACASDESWV